MKLPQTIFSGYHGANHCQGIAIDEKKGFVYYSFTTKLIKCTLDGRLVGSVDGLIGHLGCIDLNEEDGRVYGSLEFKNDQIGKWILQSLSLDGTVLQTAFYCAIFDVDKIDREGMNAERDGIMRTVYLPDVVADFNATVTENGNTHPHKYACSGIDGTAFGPAFGKKDGKQFLNICYGVYGDVARSDNDYQIILQYDAKGWWEQVAKPLSLPAMHQSGEAALQKYFLYTGNTTYGVQNLLYDKASGDWLAAVYPGKKPQFHNYTLFVIDGLQAPTAGVHTAYGEEITTLSLKSASYFPLGATGMATPHAGCYYFSDAAKDSERGQYTTLRRYQKGTAADEPFVPDNTKT